MASIHSKLKERLMNKLRLRALLASACLLVGLFIALHTAATTSLIWTSKADLPTQLRGVGTTVINGKLYAFGGTTDGSSGITSIYEYSPTTNSWSLEPTTMPFGTFNTAVVNFEGKAYIIGGIDHQRAVESYDPSDDTVTRLADLPLDFTGFNTHGAAIVNGKIYAIGGVSNNGAVYEYDIAQDIWTAKTSMAVPRGNLGIAEVGGKIYAIGGLSSSSILPTMDEYDPSTDVWTTKSDMPTARYQTSAVSLANGKIYVVGGINSNSELVSTVEEYDPSTDTWTTSTNMPTALYGMGLASDSSKFYSVGGGDDVNTSTVVGTVEEASVVTLSIDTVSLADTTVSANYSQTVQASNGTTPFAWSIFSGSLPTGLSLDSLTGEISGNATGSGTFNFTVEVTDANSQTDTQDLSIVVNEAPDITTTSLSSATITGSYSKILQVSGGASPFTWSLASGSLPSGMSLSLAGVLSGTPTVSGTFSFIAQVADAYGVIDTQSLSLIVNIAPAITRNIIPDVKVGHNYNQTITASGGTTPLTWSISAGSLPAGLSINSGNGLISGSPTTVGTYNFTVQVTDANNVSVTKAFSIQVKP
jgi:N-acetylneuraminic acid mutarotase